MVKKKKTTVGAGADPGSWLVPSLQKERERIKKASLGDEKVLLWMAKKARSKQKKAM